MYIQVSVYKFEAIGLHCFKHLKINDTINKLYSVCLLVGYVMSRCHLYTVIPFDSCKISSLNGQQELFLFES